MEANSSSCCPPRPPSRGSVDTDWHIIDSLESESSSERSHTPRLLSCVEEHRENHFRDDQEHSDVFSSPECEKLADSVLGLNFNYEANTIVSLEGKPSTSQPTSILMNLLPIRTQKAPSIVPSTSSPSAAAATEPSLPAGDIPAVVAATPPLDMAARIGRFLTGADCSCGAGGSPTTAAATPIRSAAESGGGVLASNGGVSAGGSGPGGYGDYLEDLRRCSSCLSCEGALDGFSDPPLESPAGGRTRARHTTAPSPGLGVDPPVAPSFQFLTNFSRMTWLEIWTSIKSEVIYEIRGAKALVCTAWSQVASYGDAVQDTITTYKLAVFDSVRQHLKSGGSLCPPWLAMGLGGVAALAVAALAGQVFCNRRLHGQLRQRDRELARLVVKILSLQDSMQTIRGAHASASASGGRHGGGGAVSRYTSASVMVPSGMY